MMGWLWSSGEFHSCRPRIRDPWPVVHLEIAISSFLGVTVRTEPPPPWLPRIQNFAKKWDEKYPVIFDIWQRNWSGIAPFFSFPEDIRKAISSQAGASFINSLTNSIKKCINAQRNLKNSFKHYIKMTSVWTTTGWPTFDLYCWVIRI